VRPATTIRPSVASLKVRTATSIAGSWSEREDLEAYLVSTLWEISLTYEPGRILKRFSTWAGIVLRRRVVDWQRAKLGRTKWQFRNADGSLRVHKRERPQFVPFDSRVIDWSGPSPKGLAIVRLVMVSSTQGWSTAEIASGLGTTRSCVRSSSSVKLAWLATNPRPTTGPTGSASSGN
jgi:hypothetical protein